MFMRHHGLVLSGLTAATLILLLACKKSPSGGDSLQPASLGDSPKAIYAPASERATYFAGTTAQSILRYCAEPMPDTASGRMASTSVEGTHKGAFEFGNDAGVSVKVDNDNSAKIGRELKITSTEMAGRSPTVLLARELMYRLCEVGLNNTPGGTAYTQAVAGYTEIAKAIVEIAAAEKTKAEGDKVKAEAEKAAAEAKLAEIAAKAAEQVSLVHFFVSTIIANVTELKDGKCAISQERLKAALKAERFNDIRSALLSLKGCGELNDELLPIAPDVLRELAVAAQTTQTKK